MPTTPRPATLSAVRLHLLKTIDIHPGCSKKQTLVHAGFGSAPSQSRQNYTRYISEMMAAGLIIHRGPTDSHIHHYCLHLTPKGINVLNEMVD